VGGRQRDQRGWALSVVYRALAPAGLALSPGKRIEELRWVEADVAAQDGSMAFDHETLIRNAVAQLRSEVDALDLPFEALRAPFTLGELQAFCEAILGRRLDKSSFRRRVADRGCVQAIPGEFRAGPNRPAQVYEPADPLRHAA
jgi:hypothetical protein